eukprot:CAMPEP_0198271574 /NCGR_PEP_ID=MMETSP1447-20131203/49744_1 /TAXON_ID=420782 /ORGANISM="Chaetoceros dichaeta, Strain CCMP1751" /LENGTH=87 /DNA_ID=CAMNT_0043964233 /DNA_START=1 /DNA_END=262 /DNA_ORIENTATION=+
MNLHSIAFAVGVDQNTNGGCYTNGNEYTTTNKVEVEISYWRLKEKVGGRVGTSGSSGWELFVSSITVALRLMEERRHLELELELELE